MFSHTSGLKELQVCKWGFTARRHEKDVLYFCIFKVVLTKKFHIHYTHVSVKSTTFTNLGNWPGHPRVDYVGQFCPDPKSLPAQDSWPPYLPLHMPHLDDDEPIKIVSTVVRFQVGSDVIQFCDCCACVSLHISFAYVGLSLSTYLKEHPLKCSSTSQSTWNCKTRSK